MQRPVVGVCRAPRAACAAHALRRGSFARGLCRAGQTSAPTISATRSGAPADGRTRAARSRGEGHAMAEQRHVARVVRIVPKPGLANALEELVAERYRERIGFP